MPRPVSWLPRLHEISRRVSNSVRSHYDRRDLESLFELQPRAAQKLLEMLPTVRIGTSGLVERETLTAFLNRVRDTDDVIALLNQVRTERAAVSCKKLRSLVRSDDRPMSVAHLSELMLLSRGRIEINFGSIEQLAQALHALARALDSDLDGFIQAYEPKRPPLHPEEADEMDILFKELESLDRATLDDSAI